MKTLADIQKELEAVEFELQATAASMARLYASVNRRLMDYQSGGDWIKLRDRIAEAERKLADAQKELMKTSDWIDQIK